jgi:hypothetical protein
MYAITVPLLPDKVDAWKSWIHECQGPRRDEFESLNERMELTLHRAWLLQTERGPQVIVVFEGMGSKTFLRRLAKSQEPFDRWFRQRITEYHGVDFSKVDAMKPSEMVLDYHAPSYVGIGEK